jgi:hypothetical protein
MRRAAPVAALIAALICPVTANADTTDVLAGITITPQHHRYDYRRAAFGPAWANGGHATPGTRSWTGN